MIGTRKQNTEHKSTAINDTHATTYLGVVIAQHDLFLFLPIIPRIQRLPLPKRECRLPAGNVRHLHVLVALRLSVLQKRLEIFELVQRSS